MATALGDFLLIVSNSATASLPSALADARRWPTHGDALQEIRVLSPAPNVAIAFSGDVQFSTDSTTALRAGIAIGREPEQGDASRAPQTVSQSAIASWLKDDSWQPTALRGRYLMVFWNAETQEVVAFTDQFRTYPLYYMATPAGFVCSSDLRLMLLTFEKRPSISRSAVYHYLNFAYVPSPHTIVEGIAKLEPGYRLDSSRAVIKTRSVTEITYPEDIAEPDGQSAEALRCEIVDAVSRYRPGENTQWGTFLSGGTDSSSIAGILAQADTNSRVDSFSIGFAEDGYDEMAYSRIAVKHFGLQGHELNVSEEDAVSLVPRLAKAFDEPFGNPSAIPTFYCADLARKHGKQLLIAGDGGDEIFGGNERYAKDQIFTWYHNSPAPLRWAGALLAKLLSLFDFNFSNRLQNMIRRGEMPNPDRFYSDDSFASDHFDELLTPQFRAAVGRDESLDIQRDIFARAQTSSELHRLMYLDLKLTIAESDLVKVICATKFAGVDVAFPYIDRTLVEYTGRLPTKCKVNGLQKRYLFKLAMESILPIEIRKKKKQGFGLPVAVWMRGEGKLRTLVNEVVLSERALNRGYFNSGFIRELIARHERGSWDHAPEIFRLLMLELWHREYLDVLEP